MSKDSSIRIGVALNARQVTRLREIGEANGVSQSAFFHACLDTLSNDEIVEILRRLAGLKEFEARQRVKDFYASKREHQ